MATILDHEEHRYTLKRYSRTSMTYGVLRLLAVPPRPPRPATDAVASRLSSAADSELRPLTRPTVAVSGSSTKREIGLGRMRGQR